MNINGALSLENYFSIEEILELNTNLKNGFKFIKPELYMKSNNFNEFIKEILENYKLGLFDYSKSAYNFERKYFSDSIIIVRLISGSHNLSVGSIQRRNWLLCQSVC